MLFKPPSALLSVILCRMTVINERARLLLNLITKLKKIAILTFLTQLFEMSSYPVRKNKLFLKLRLKSIQNKIPIAATETQNFSLLFKITLRTLTDNECKSAISWH